MGSSRGSGTETCCRQEELLIEVTANSVENIMYGADIKNLHVFAFINYSFKRESNEYWNSPMFLYNTGLLHRKLWGTYPLTCHHLVY